MTHRSWSAQTAPARALGIVAVVGGAAYLAWRVAATSLDVHPALFWPLLAIETITWITLVAAVTSTRPAPRSVRLAPLDVFVDVVIIVDGEELDLVEPSAIAALALRGRTRTHLYDRSDRSDVRALADRLGIHYVSDRDHAADPASIDDVLPDLTGRLLLALRAGQVPALDALLATTGAFALETMAIVEIDPPTTGAGDRDPFNAALPSRRRLPSAVLLRTSALRAVGGPLVTGADARAEGLSLLRAAGYSALRVDEPLIAEAGAESGRSGTNHSPEDSGTSASPVGSALIRLVITGKVIIPLALVVFAALVGFVGLEPLRALDTAGLVIVGAWLLLQSAAAAALRRAGSGGLDTVTTTLLALEPRFRALGSTRSGPLADPDETTRSDLVRLLRAPVVVAVTLAAVLLARAADDTLRVSGSPGFLPPLEGSTTIVLIALGLVPIVAVGRLLVRVRRRQRLHRRLQRFPTELAARVRGITVACVDLHHRGAALIVPRELADDVGTITFAVACRSIAGTSTPAHGTMTITSRRPVDPEGTMLRIGGSVVWNDDESRTRVISHCYIAEPYAARHRTWVRAAARVPVALDARLDGGTATCVDVSETGAAFVTRDGHWLLEDRVPAELTLSPGKTVTGEFSVRNITATPAGLVRLGGTAHWASTSWLVRYGAAPSADPAGRRQR